MAVKPKVNGLVRLTADETVIGVVLERKILGDVTVRPTNVTAAMSSAPAHQEITSAALGARDIGTPVSSDAGGIGARAAGSFDVGDTNSITITANAQLAEAAGRELSVGSLIKVEIGTGEVIARVTSNTETRVSFFVDQVRTVTFVVIEVVSAIPALTSTSVVTAVRTIRDGGPFTSGSSHTIPFPSGTNLHGYDAGDIVRIGNAAGTSFVRASVSSVSELEIHIVVTEEITSPVLTVATNGTVEVLLLEIEDTDFILLQNGAKGGFRQEFKGPAGQYYVNDVIKALVTDA